MKKTTSVLNAKVVKLLKRVDGGVKKEGYVKLVGPGFQSIDDRGLILKR